MKHIKAFNIKASTKRPGKKNCYEIIVEFMVGDADGERKEKFEFTEDQMKDPVFKEYVSDFIDSINGCMQLDSNGRVGFDGALECSEWYAGGFDRCGDEYGGVPSWSRFCQDSTYINKKYLPLMHKSRDVNGMEGEVEMEPFQTENNPFAYSVPTDEGGYYCSYENCTMYYYDSNGEKFEVDIS